MFLPLLTPISVALDRHFDTFADPNNRQVMISAIDRDALKARIFATFKEIADTYNPPAPWFDKTGNPEMIEAIPFLRRLWPEAVFIFAKRRGIENVISRLRKFPVHSFEYHCRDWARNMAVWRAIRDTLPANHRREVDQQDMIQNPEKVVDELIALLDVDVVRRDQMLRTLRTNRPQQTHDGSATLLHDLTSCGWTEAQVEVFRRFCSAEMEAYGYSTTSSYWATP